MVLISNHLTKGNVHFIYRKNGTEVMFEIVDNKDYSHYDLTTKEKTHIKKYYLKNRVKIIEGEQQYQSKMNRK